MKHSLRTARATWLARPSSAPGYFLGLLLLAAALLAPGRAAAQTTLGGTVFEDVNYGGGAGRNYATANAAASGFGSGSIRRPGATVELYDAAGAYLTTTTTDAAGAYSFGGLAAGNYTVRVLNGSVTSSRPGSTGALVPVQTFRTNAGADDANRVGGENPAGADAGPNSAAVVTSAVTGNNILLAFAGQTSTGDNTLFLDNVEVLSGGVPLVTNPIANPGFEAGTLVPTGSTAPANDYQYNPTAAGVAWTFSSQSGIYGNNSAFSPPNTAAGNRAGFLQLSGTASQAFNLPAGTYQVRFVAANRVSGGQQAVNVTVNGFVVRAGLQAVAGTFATYQTAAFAVGPGGTAVALSGLAAQSLAPVSVAAAPVTGVDFGFSFDVVTNTNDAGQGSVRQFILNANALTNANLAQAGLVAGRETSVFMIPNGATAGAPAGLRNGLANGLNASSGANRWARLQVLSALPTLTDAGTTLDGGTQTANVQDSNPGRVGLGGPGGQFATVGTGGVAFAQFERPEVEIYGLNNLGNVVVTSANNATVRNLALHGTGGTVRVGGGTGVVVEDNLIGTTAFAIADPLASLANSASGNGVSLGGGLLGVAVRRNVVAFCSSTGVNFPNGGTSAGSDVLVLRNELVQNGYRVAGGDNISVGDGGGSGPIRILYNLIRTSNSDGIQFDIGQVALGGVGYNVVRNNTFFDSGNGGESLALSQLEGAALLYLQRTAGSGTTAANPDSIAFNVFNQTQASAIAVGYGQRGIIMSRNSTYFNGTPFNKPTGGNLGIDLIADPSYAVNANQDYGNGDGVTPNDGALATGPANGGMDYPILTLATATGTTSATVNVRGFVGSAPGQTQFGGAIVELYTADNVQANNNGPVSTINPTIIAHGEGRTYLGTLVCDASGNFSGTLTVPNGTPPLSGDAITGSLTATAYLPGQGTSEFGPNRPIIVSADVEANITASSGPTLAGGTGSFTVTFENQTFLGPVTASGVVATVQLPPGLSGVSATGGGSYNPVTGLVTYAGYTTGSPGSLASGASFSSVITYTQPASAPVTATAAISTTTNEAGQTANNTAVATNTTLPRYDVATTISGPTAATAGNQVAYNVTTTHVGGAGFPSAAPLVAQTVSVPAGASNVFVTGGGVVTGSTGAGFTVTFPVIAALAPGQSLTNTVSFTAPTGNYTVGANVSSSPADAVSGNNAASAATTVSAPATGPANAFVLVSASALNAAPGTPVSFTVTQGNRGPNPATGVQTTVVIPPGLPITGAGAVTIAGAGPTGTSGTTATYAGGATYNSATGLVTFPVIASQNPGAGSNASYVIGFAAPALGVATATAAVLTASPDALPADNQATAQVTVTPTAPADLALTLSGPSGATVGQALTYTLTTTNNGPAAATGVRQTVFLPAGLATSGFQQLTINGAGPTGVVGPVATYAGGTTYNSASGLLSVAPTASLSPAGVLTTTIAYPAPANGDLSLGVTAGVTGTSFDPSLANNTASLTTSLLPSADVQVTLTGVGQIAPGNRLTYGVTAFNNGPSAAPGVATTVNLPTGLPIAGANAVRVNGALPSGTSGTTATYPDGSTYNSASGLVTLPALTNLQPGAAGLNTVSYVLPLGYTGTLVSTATALVSGIADPITANNVAVVQPLVVPAVGSNNLGVAISGPASVTAGQPVAFTLTTTSPGAASSGVLQFVQLAPGLTANGGTVTVTLGGSPVAVAYDPLSGLLTLPATALAAGGSLTYTINVSQAPGSGPLLATASASANELDSNPANNVAQASVGIVPVVNLITTVVGPATVPAGTTASYLITTANGGPSTATGAVQTVTVPAGATNVQLNGLPVTPGAGGVLVLPIPATLAPGGANNVGNILSFTAPGAAGSSYAVPANLSATGPGSPASASASQPTAISSPAPLARNVVNTLQAPQANTAAAPLPILPLSGLAQGVASLASYTIQALPPASQGVLYVFDGVSNVVLNTANFPGLVLTPAQAAALRFLPAPGFSGNATFLYLTTDNGGTPSNTARYLVPVAPDANSLYATTPVKGGATPYATNDVLAFVFDPSGATYTPAGALYNPTTGQLVGGGAGISNGLPTTGTNAVLAGGTLPPGTALNPATGQIFVNNPAALVPGTYTVSITTTDVFGGTNTQPVTFVIGTRPLPVELVSFEAKASNRDARLTWRTASERNNARFDVERSRNGRDFTKFAEVTGQGSTQAPTAYALTDADAQQFGTTVYYRLVQVDTDGRTATSPVQAVAFGKAARPTVSLYPNPATAATATATLDLRELPTGPYAVTLTDLSGRLVRTLTLEAGALHPLALSDLATGTYLLHVQGTAANAALRLTQRLTRE